MKNYTFLSTTKDARIELHDQLGLTGAEVSINTLPAGGNVPFLHAHKNNEEIYGVLAGKGKVIVDGEEITLNQGDWIKVKPIAKRQFFADKDSEITYICIQVKENSLESFTMDDAVAF